MRRIRPAIGRRGESTWHIMNHWPRCRFGRACGDGRWDGSARRVNAEVGIGGGEEACGEGLELRPKRDIRGPLPQGAMDSHTLLVKRIGCGR